MNLYQSFTLGEHLSEWPEIMGYEEIIQSLCNEDNEQIIVCEDLCTLWHKDVADVMQIFKQRLEQCFIPREVK